MRSSACKYVLDKVSKFEKKYAKPLQKNFTREDDDFLTFQDDNSSSEHVENIIKVVKSNSASVSDVNRNTYQKKRLNGSYFMGHSTMDDSNTQSISNSIQDTCKATKREREYMKQKTSHMEIEDGNDRGDNKKIDIHFLSDDVENILRQDMKHKRSCEDIDGSMTHKVHEDSHTFAKDHLKDTLISTEKEMDSGEPESPFIVDIHEGEVKNGRLQVSLNLKLDEDSDEISDISSKGIASLSLEKSKSSENIPVRVFHFEDLIGAEEIKSISEKFKENSQLNMQISRTFDNSRRTSLLSADDLHFNSKPDDEQINETSKSSVQLQEIKTNVYESSIEEDLEDVTDISFNKNYNISSKQVNSFSNQVMLSVEGDTKINKSTVISENKENDGYNISKFKDSRCSDKTIPDFAGNDSSCDISFEKSESDVIYHNVENKEKELIEYNPEEFCGVKNHSEQDLKLTFDEHNRIKKKDNKHIKYVKQDHNREKYLEREWKLLNRSKNVFQNKLHNESTQMGTFLAETHDFETRMETIMKTSFNSMTDVNNLSVGVNNMLSELSSHTVTVSDLKPIERGFHCALRQQIELTKHFVCAEYSMYAVCMAAIKEMASSYRPATLHYSKKMKQNMSSKKSQEAMSMQSP